MLSVSEYPTAFATEKGCHCQRLMVGTFRKRSHCCPLNSCVRSNEGGRLQVALLHRIIRQLVLEVFAQVSAHSFT